MIPKRIILTAKSRSVLSEVQVQCVEQIHLLHKDYEILFFDDNACASFVQTQAPEFYELYQHFPRPIQKSDLFRVLAVFFLGGIYLDCDVFLRRHLDALLDYDLALCAEWTMPLHLFKMRYQRPPQFPDERLQVGNYGFAAVQGHAFLHCVLEQIIARTSALNLPYVEEDDVYFSTGPDIFTTVFHHAKHAVTGNAVLLEGDPEATFVHARPKEWKNEWFQFGNFGYHIMTGTWKQPRSLKRKRNEEMTFSF